MALTAEIEASEKGANRRRADYVVLEYLNRVGAASEHELDYHIKEIHEKFVEEGGTSPFYFKAGGSNGPNSRELNNSIDRCLHFDRVEFTEDNEYRITSKGQNYLDDSPTLERHGISSDFQSEVSEHILSLF